jgi:hypothetical protein
MGVMAELDAWPLVGGGVAVGVLVSGVTHTPVSATRNDHDNMYPLFFTFFGRYADLLVYVYM